MFRSYRKLLRQILHTQGIISYIPCDIAMSSHLQNANLIILSIVRVHVHEERKRPMMHSRMDAMDWMRNQMLDDEEAQYLQLSYTKTCLWG